MVGQQLATLRKACGLTQRAAAKKAGIDTRYLQRIESGEVSPTVAWLTRYYEALGLEPPNLEPRKKAP